MCCKPSCFIAFDFVLANIFECQRHYRFINDHIGNNCDSYEYLLVFKWLLLLFLRDLFTEDILCMTLIDVSDRMYMAFETLTEPHQLSAMLHSLAFVSRVMLNREKFPDGASHALPLLKLVLPGIDPNDFFKSVVGRYIGLYAVLLHNNSFCVSQSVFTFISTFSCLIPFVDCSKTPQLRNDLTDVKL